MRQNVGDPDMKPGVARPEERERERELEPAVERERLRGGDALWQDIKSRFVDDPAAALSAADDLVRQVIEDKIRRLKEEHEELRRGGQEGADPASATEDMRTRLVRYQAYYERILGVTEH
jgi:enoyl-CoA hydratase/carnithine racemase